MLAGSGEWSVAALDARSISLLFYGDQVQIRGVSIGVFFREQYPQHDMYRGVWIVLGCLNNAL